MTSVAEDGPIGARMTVVGVGGGGGNAVESMIEAKVAGVEFTVANTDCQALARSSCLRRIQLGSATTRGLGAGADPEVGRRSAEESSEALVGAVTGADMVFVTAGMGGGTGTGAAPTVARLAREAGALTVAVVTRPFFFEGKRRARQAQEGIDALAQEADALLVVPNDRLLELRADVPVHESFALADSVLVHAVEGIAGVIRNIGKINVDFADVRSVMSIRGRVLMGLGQAKGPDRALRAATQAIESPLLDDVSIDGAMGLLINVTGGPGMTLREIQLAASSIEDRVHEDANVIVGSVIDPTAGDELRVTVVATGLPMPGQKRQERPLAAVATPAPAARPPLYRPTPAPAPARGAIRFQSTRLAAWDARPTDRGPTLPGFEDE